MLQKPDIEYLSVGGDHLKKLGIKSIYDLKEITYLGFTSVLLNFFKIKSKINKTVEESIRFQPEILFSVDSPDFTKIDKKIIKKINKNIFSKLKIKKNLIDNKELYGYESLNEFIHLTDIEIFKKLN